MEKYYSKEKLLNSMYDMVVDDGMVVTVLDKDDLESVPTADVRPVIHAHWIEHEMYCICNSCNALATAYFNYCPFCGAKMDEEVDDG